MGISGRGSSVLKRNRLLSWGARERVSALEERKALLARSTLTTLPVCNEYVLVVVEKEEADDEEAAVADVATRLMMLLAVSPTCEATAALNTACALASLWKADRAQFCSSWLTEKETVACSVKDGVAEGRDVGWARGCREGWDEGCEVG